MAPRTPTRARKSAKRAFSGMVGRVVPEEDDCLVEPSAEEVEQAAQTVLKGSGLYYKLKREWGATDEAISTITISNARKPKPSSWAEVMGGKKPKWNSRPVRNSDLHTQKVRGDRSLRGGAPEGTNHLPSAQGSISEVVQDITGTSAMESKNPGIYIFQAGTVSRLEIPDWVRDDKLIDGYFNLRWEVDVVDEELPLTRALDRLILKEYFLENHTDEMIFEDHKKDFRRERRALGREERWTSSPDAVKHRRDRMLREYKQIFDPQKKWTPTSLRGIIVKSRESTLWETKYIGIVTDKRRRSTAKIVDDMGYYNAFEEPAEVAAEGIFNNRQDLEQWMADHGLRPEDIEADNTF